MISTVSIVRSQSGQCCCRAVGELAQFGHLCQNSGGHDRPNTGNGIQSFGFKGELRVSSDEFQNGLIAGLDLPVQQAQTLPGLTATQRLQIVFGAIALSTIELRLGMHMPLKAETSDILLRVNEAENAIDEGILAVASKADEFVVALLQAIAAGETSKNR